MNEIRELIDKLNYYTKLYDEGKSPITDKEWDDMYFKLAKLENKYNEYYQDSPTQRVNYEVVNELKKVKHSHPMLSLAKTKLIDELNSFIGNKECLVMAKLDGLTCSLTYDGGRLIAAETRGNGEIGEDILHNALVVKNIPNKIDYKNKLIIDGEIICDYKSFKEFENDYKNPRNFASGSIRLLDSKECEKRKLSFIAWDVIEGFDDNEFLNTRLIELEVLGFTVVPMKPTDTITIEEKIEEIKSKCKDFGYPIDGCVIKYNNVNEYNAAGRTDHHFKGGIAFKFYDDEYETELLDIEYDIGRTGQLTPVAIYKDIDIDGTICNRASLHNISVMKELLGNAYIGQKIKVFKSNMIIPVISNAQNEKGEWIH